MASCFFVLHFPFITFLFFIVVSLSKGDNAQYTACSFLYSCGNIQNIGYPFWGGERPNFCGIPEFKLSCDSSNVSTSMHVFGADHGHFQVHNINTSTHNMFVSPEKPCHLDKLKNKTGLFTSKPITDYENITLIYDCNPNYVLTHQAKSLNCSGSDGFCNGTAYYFGDPSDKHNTSSCKNNVTFAVNKTSFQKLQNKNASLEDVLSDSRIVLEYDFTACSVCEKSGGRCGSNQTSGKKSRKFLELGTGGVIFVLVIIVICQCSKLKFGHSKLITRSASLDTNASELRIDSIKFGMTLFSFSELAEATDNFDQSQELGNGGFGIVYYGKLKDGREVAVKRLYEKNYRRMEQFMNEIQILTRLRHQNLVSLYGCTSKHSRELILVYEYIKNGTVADHLYGKNSNSGILSWPIRLRIAIETAMALSHLHASDIIHRDVKTNNILLDSNFSVKVADFGLSRLFPTDVTHVSTAPQGTPGYLDPEYYLCYKLTNKSDVYSFGVVLVELISSLPAINMDREKLEINLANFAMNRIKQCAFDELVDPQLGFACDYKIRRMTTSVAELAFQCLQHDKEFRPSMDEVLQRLKRIEGADYEALQAEETRSNDLEEMVKLHRINHTPPPIEDDEAQLLRNHEVYPPSPISVTDNWISKSSTSSSIRIE